VADGPGTRCFSFGDCRLDLDRGTLTRGGALAPLRAKSFALLCYLARNAGRVVAKDELLDHVWPDVTVTEDSLTQAIRDLRRAIGDERQELVRTIPRRGYLFALPSPAAAAGRGGPRVAVLPFRDLTGDVGAGVMLDGLVEEITNGLARFRTVTVIARHSAFAFRPENRPALEEVTARLAADYLVEGSVRRSGERFAVAAELVEAASGRQVWGEGFDCGPEELLALQQAIPRRIVPRLASNIEDAVLDRATAAPTASLSAFEHFTRGLALLRSFGEGGNERGRAPFARATEIDPGFGLAEAYVALADVVIGGYGMAPREVLEAARARALAAVDLAPGEARCHRILGQIRSYLGEYAAAEEAMRRACEFNPFDADSLAAMCVVLDIRGRAAEALEWIDRAIALNPLHPAYYHTDRSYPLFFLGRYEESAAELALLPRLSVRQETRLAATLALAGRMEEAARHLDRAEAMEPGWRHMEVTRESYRCERPEDLEHLLAGVRAALAGRERLRSRPAAER
jgi:TolB-like protein/DNA-binding winged helix-turn-helix (wHTH) protein